MNIIKKAYNWCLKPEHLFFITLITLILPNAALCITDGLSVTASLANVLLPLGCYWLLMSMGSGLESIFFPPSYMVA